MRGAGELGVGAGRVDHQEVVIGGARPALRPGSRRRRRRRARSDAAARAPLASAQRARLAKKRAIDCWRRSRSSTADPRAVVRQRHGEVDGDGGLAGPALLVADHDHAHARALRGALSAGSNRPPAPAARDTGGRTRQRDLKAALDIGRGRVRHSVRLRSPQRHMTDPTLPIVRTVADLRAAVRGWREAGERVALVPTMGFLHEGHLSLVRLGQARADRVVASLFVNPTQFAPSEDFEAYPRDEARDAALLAGAGCDLLYAPTLDRDVPAGLRHHGQRGRGLGADGRPRRGRSTSPASRPSSPSCSSSASRTSRSSARRTTSSCWSSSAWRATSTCRSRSSARRRCASRRPRPLLAQHLPHAGRARRRRRAQRRCARPPRRCGPARRCAEAEADGLAALTEAGFGESTISRCAAPRTSPGSVPARPTRRPASSWPPGSARPG